jgi:hypothetical protein
MKRRRDGLTDYRGIAARLGKSLSYVYWLRVGTRRSRHSKKRKGRASSLRPIRWSFTSADVAAGIVRAKQQEETPRPPVF